MGVKGLTQLNPFDPEEWLTSSFSLQYYGWIKHKAYESKGYDHQIKKALINKQIILISTLGNVYRTLWRIGMLILG